MQPSPKQSTFDGKPITPTGAQAPLQSLERSISDLGPCRANDFTVRHIPGVHL